MSNRKLPLSVAIGLSALLTACAGTPPQNELVSQARNTYQGIENDPNVARSGAVAMREAQEHLQKAEEMLEEGKDEELVEHEAYLAWAYAEIAEARGKQNELQQSIESAQQRRDQLKLEMSSAETRQARMAAKRAQNEAQLAQQETAQLRQQMQELRNLQAKQTDRGMVLTLGDVLFEVDKAKLQGSANKTIDELAKFMQKYEKRRIRVEGYTDSTGSETYNQHLSEERAKSVREALVEEGIDPSRIEVKGYGEAYPVATNDDPAGRARNRRVEIVISDPEGNVQSR